MAIARALACEPEVLLLDEPTANVDIENRLAIEDIITTLRDERKTSHRIVLCATHTVVGAGRVDVRLVGVWPGTERELRDSRLIAEDAIVNLCDLDLARVIGINLRRVQAADAGNATQREDNDNSRYGLQWRVIWHVLDSLGLE